MIFCYMKRMEEITKLKNKVYMQGKILLSILNMS